MHSHLQIRVRSIAERSRRLPVLFIALALPLWLQAQDHQVVRNPYPLSPILSPERSNGLPIFDLMLMNDHATQDPDRVRAKAYDLPFGPLYNQTAGDLSDILGGHPGKDSDPLPVRDSDLILIATVGAARAYLSANASQAYSVYRLNVTSTLEATKHQAVTTLDADANGAVLRLPSGQLHIEGGVGQGFLRTGASYLLFLKSRKDRSGYLILNGYEIRDAKTEPLMGRPSDPNSSYRRYDGQSLSILEADIRLKVNREQVGGGK